MMGVTRCARGWHLCRSNWQSDRRCLSLNGRPILLKVGRLRCKIRSQLTSLAFPFSYFECPRDRGSIDPLGPPGPPLRERLCCSAALEKLPGAPLSYPLHLRQSSSLLPPESSASSLLPPSFLPKILRLLFSMFCCVPMFFRLGSCLRLIVVCACCSFLIFAWSLVLYLLPSSRRGTPIAARPCRWRSSGGGERGSAFLGLHRADKAE